MDNTKNEKAKNKDWKSYFLSSSYPLEFELTKLLIKYKYAVEGEFPYNRKDRGETKEFSIDINALNCLHNDENENDILEISLLIEVKYRRPGTKWLFIPEINNLDNYKVDSQESRLLNVVDEFSEKYFNTNDLLKTFEKNISTCLKGIELKNDGTVVDSEIKHGIYQLRYGLPYFYMDKIDFNLLRNTHNIPFLVCPILVTTAPLYILNKECTISTVEKCERLEDIANQVPYLTSYYPIGGDFIKHSKKVFSDFNNYLLEHKNMIYFNQARVYDKLYSPHDIVKGLHYGLDHTLNRYFGKVIVCSFDNFESFLSGFHKKIEDLASYQKTNIKNLTNL